MRGKIYRKIPYLTGEMLQKITTEQELLIASKLLLAGETEKQTDCFSVRFFCSDAEGYRHMLCVDAADDILIFASVPERSAEQPDTELYVSHLPTGCLQAIMPFRPLYELSADIGHTLLAAQLLCDRPIRQIGFLSSCCRLLDHVEAFDRIFDLESIGILADSAPQQEACLNRVSGQAESPVYFYRTPKALVEASDLIICPDDGSAPDVLPEWIRRRALIIDYTGGRNIPAALIHGAQTIVIGNREMDEPALRQNENLCAAVQRCPRVLEMSDVIQENGWNAQEEYCVYLHGEHKLAAVALAQVVFRSMDGQRKLKQDGLSMERGGM